MYNKCKNIYFIDFLINNELKKKKNVLFLGMHFKNITDLKHFNFLTLVKLVELLHMHCYQ